MAIAQILACHMLCSAERPVRESDLSGSRLRCFLEEKCPQCLWGSLRHRKHIPEQRRMMILYGFGKIFLGSRSCR